MKLHIAGVNHNDPLGRGDLKKWLKNLSDTKSEQPAFIAVEYDENQFKQWKNQRPYFGQLCQKEWPNLSENILDILESSLVYEGDAHLEIFPSTEILWLDEGKVLNSDEITNYAKYRLDIYKGFLSNPTRLCVSELREKTWGRSQAPQSPERDFKFAELIKNEAVKSTSEWAIIIVGAYHACQNINENMFCLLKNDGYTCISEILGP